MEQNPYNWTKKDKWLYALSLIPVFIMFFLGFKVMVPICIYMFIIWILIYIIVNIFQAACCIGCPYKGKYCPPIFGIYMSNILSDYLYRDFESEPDFFKKNAKGGEISLLIFLLYPTYWLFITDWTYLLLYLSMIILHLVIFMPIQCRKCSYNKICPGGKSYLYLCRGKKIMP